MKNKLMKTELEEAAFNFTAGKSVKEICSRMDFIKGSKFGSEWQQEQDKKLYSEEDLREAFRQGEQNISYSETYGLDSELTEQQWFEQFKK